MSGQHRYAAFISYSSADARFAQRLHRALESYGIPATLGRFDLAGKANRIYPVFRDREELSAGDLGERITRALEASGALIVVCSPNAAASPWVQKEIEHFIALGHGDSIFAVIADDAPVFDAGGADATAACFPPALRGDALGGALEPLAADARKGKDGFRNAWLKLVAGMIGLTPGQIIDRDKKRRRQQSLVFGAAGAAFAVVLAYGGYQALRPVSLADCAVDRLTFADPWGGQSFAVSRVGEHRRRACEDDAPVCEQEVVITVFEGAYTDPDTGFRGPMTYALQQWPMAAPCCWWDAAETPEHFDADISGAELRWFEPGRAPALSSLPLASIELDDLFATAANDHQLTVTRNPMLAQSCRQRPLL
jgi:hypothetical protein